MCLHLSKNKNTVDSFEKTHAKRSGHLWGGHPAPASSGFRQCFQPIPAEQPDSHPQASQDSNHTQPRPQAGRRAKLLQGGLQIAGGGPSPWVQWRKAEKLLGGRLGVWR